MLRKIGSEIAFRRIIFLTSFAALILIAAAVLFYNQQKTAIKSELFGELQGIADFKINELNNWLRERKSDAELYYTNLDFKNDVESYINSNDSKPAKIILNSWFQTLYDYHDYRNIYLLNYKGEAIYSYKTGIVGINKETAEVALRSLSRDSLELSELIKDPAANIIYLQYFIPLIKQTKHNKPQKLGVLVLRIDPNKILYPTIKGWPFPTKTAESYLVKKEGKYILYLSKLKYMKHAEVTYKVPLNKSDFASERAIKGVKGFYEGKDYRNKNVLADLRKVPGTNWFIVTKIDIDELYTPIQIMGVRILVGLLFIIFTSILLLLLILKNRQVKEQEQQLIEKNNKIRLQKRLELLLKNANSIIVVTDKDKKIIDANDLAVKVYGYKKEEILHLSIYDLRADKFKNNVDKDFQEADEKNGSIYLSEHKKKNGDTFPVEVSLSPINMGDEKLYQEIIRDITNLRDSEKKIMRLNRVYSLLSNINQLIVREKDRSKLFRESCRIVVEDGRLKMSWIGFADFLHSKVLVEAKAGNVENYFDNFKIMLDDSLEGSGPTAKCIKTGMHQVCNDIENDPAVIPWRSKMLENSYLSSAAFPLKMYGKTVGAFNMYSEEKNYFDKDELKLLDEMAVDISFAIEYLDSEEKRNKAEAEYNQERNKYENELKEAKDHAEEMNRLKSSFLANMSHELRTPLIGILGFSDILKELSLSKEHREYADIIKRSGLRLLETLNLILDLSKIEAGQLQIQKKEIDVVPFIQDAIMILSITAKEKGLYINITGKEKEIIVLLDERMFREIIINLVNNAIKYTQAGGITINIETEEVNENKQLVISICDTGIGIAKDKLELIFDPFRQVSEGYNRVFQGSGLGLTITKKYVETLNGNIKVESTPGKGTSFIVSLPFTKSDIFVEIDKPDAKINLLKELKDGNKAREKILFVDDDETTRDYIKIILKKHFIVDLALNGEQAIDMVKSHSYSAILLDVNLGSGFSGVETLKEIKKAPGYLNVPVLAVTGYAMDSDKEKLLNMGFHHYLSKPFDKEELIFTINKMLGKI